MRLESAERRGAMLAGGGGASCTDDGPPCRSDAVDLHCTQINDTRHDDDSDDVDDDDDDDDVIPPARDAVKRSSNA